MSWALKHDDGTYYQGRSGIGPMFGGTVEEAKRFPSRVDAALEMGWHSAMGSTEPVEVPPKTKGAA